MNYYFGSALAGGLLFAGARMLRSQQRCLPVEWEGDEPLSISQIVCLHHSAPPVITETNHQIALESAALIVKQFWRNSRDALKERSGRPLKLLEILCSLETEMGITAADKKLPLMHSQFQRAFAKSTTASECLSKKGLLSVGEDLFDVVCSYVVASAVLTFEVILVEGTSVLAHASKFEPLTLTSEVSTEESDEVDASDLWAPVFDVQDASGVSLLSDSVSGDRIAALNTVMSRCNRYQGSVCLWFELGASPLHFVVEELIAKFSQAEAWKEFAAVATAVATSSETAKALH